MGNLNFDATNVPPAESFDPLPDGWYTWRFIGAEIVNSEKAGEMLKLQLEIDETVHPEYYHRQVWGNLCINHPNDTPRHIAQRQLSAICDALGKPGISDTEELLGERIDARIVTAPAREVDGKTYDARNEIKAFRAAGGGDDETAGTKEKPKSESNSEPKAKAAAKSTVKAPTRSAGWKK